MARIRSIKPEFWSSEQIMECSVQARLLFIGLWNFCDDEGNCPMKPRQIKAQVFPGDDFTADTVHGMVSELVSNGLLLSYAVDGQDYLHVTGWRHQVINRPQKAKYPTPGSDNSVNGNGALTPDRKGKERKGEEADSSLRSESGVPPPAEQKTEAQTEPIVAPNQKPKDPDAELFRRGREVLGKSAGGQIAKLKKALGLEKALEAIEQAARKDGPAEYVAGILKAQPSDEPDYKRREREERESWVQRMEYWRKTGGWDDTWGFPPDDPHTMVPVDLRPEAVDLAIPASLARRKAH